MVDRNNLQQVNMLYAEARSIDQALQGFDNGGRIVGMSISPGPLPEGDDPGMPRPISMGISVSTVDIDYPPEMAQAIREKLQARKIEIETELEGLGLNMGVTQQADVPPGGRRRQRG